MGRIAALWRRAFIVSRCPTRNLSAMSSGRRTRPRVKAPDLWHISRPIRFLVRGERSRQRSSDAVVWRSLGRRRERAPSVGARAVAHQVASTRATSVGNRLASYIASINVGPTTRNDCSDFGTTQPTLNGRSGNARSAIEHGGFLHAAFGPTARPACNGQRAINTYCLVACA